jgi:hypothetical protein
MRGMVCRVSFETSETSFSTIRNKKRLFRLFHIYIETASLGVSNTEVGIDTASRSNARHRSNTRHSIERSGGGVGGGEYNVHPLLIDHISSGMFPTPRKRNREYTWRKFLTKLKIMYKEMGLALYSDLHRLLTIRIFKDRFNVKKHCGLEPRLFQRSKEKSVTSRSYTFLNCQRCR